jgi:hypothetical protein
VIAACGNNQSDRLSTTKCESVKEGRPRWIAMLRLSLKKDDGDEGGGGGGRGEERRGRKGKREATGRCVGKGR